MEASTHWASIRAALIACLLAFNLLIATPTPPRLTPDHFERPDAAEELDGWLGLTRSLGLGLDRADLIDLAIRGSNLWIDVRSTAIGRPTWITRRYLGIRQNWALFARPDTWPTVLTVDIRTGKEPWQEVFRTHHPEHDLLEPQLRYRRMRGIYDFATKPTGTYLRLTQWVAHQTLELRPEATAVRVRTLQLHTVRPGQKADPTQKVLHRVVIPRKAR